jgi:NADH dehydrogenase FAD-containing subunit
MKQIISSIVAVALVIVFAPFVSAHEVTYRGTVVALETGRYAQPAGGMREVQELHVTVVDAKTKRPSQRVFVIVDATRIFRGESTVALADAAIQKGESVAVTVDHDKPGDEAITIRLEPRG